MISRPTCRVFQWQLILAAFGLFALALAAVVIGSTTSLAQVPPGVSATPTEAKAKHALPDPLTQSAIRDLLAGLDDQQVRELLIKRLSDQADAQARAKAAADHRGLGELLAGYAAALGNSMRVTLARAEQLPTLFGRYFSRFDQQRGARSYAQLIFALFAAFVAGAATTAALWHFSRPWEDQILASEPISLWDKLRLIVARFLFQTGRVVAFFIAALAINSLLTEVGSPDRITIHTIVVAIAWTWLFVVMARFVLAPQRPALRLCPLDDETARFLTWRIGLVAAIANFGFGYLSWMLAFGMKFGETRFGFWVTLAMTLAILATIWQARRGISAMLTVDDAPRERSGFRIGEIWPGIAIAMVIAHWLIVELLVATGNASAALLPRMLTTLTVLMALPLLEHAMRATIRNLFPLQVDDETALPLSAQRETHSGFVRCGRVMLGLAIVFGLLGLWNIDVHALARQGIGARLASAFIDVTLIALIAYGLWEAVTIATRRQIAIERAAMGIDDDAEQMADGEGGKGETRLATILPLARFCLLTAVAIFAALAIISRLGVNITPLLAGAGIVGLAIGFGAQTLVKDIISGVFFLIDDAFRKGEYIDIGSVKGTVEKISVRSMQLRHHNGPLNTVPFGAIDHVTNFSRDWVVMKLPLRLTYDTDAEKVRKMIKKLGQEMQADPVLGPQFLQPLKSQGVIQMEDSAMIMRVKFMTKPGDQWVIRRTVFARIRDLFEKEGIKFANREVTVRFAEEDADRQLSDAERRAVGAAARPLLETETGRA